MKTKNMKRKILRKYNTEKKENLDQVIEEQKVSSANTQRFFRYRKRQNHTIKIKCVHSPAISSVPNFMQSAAGDNEAVGFKGWSFLDY